jgi:O-antigen/teichoic acid export membrane protein
LALAGIDNLFVREYVKDINRDLLIKYSIRTRFFYSLLGALISIAFVVIATPYNVLVQHWRSLLLMQLSVIFVIFEVGDLINQAKNTAFVSAQIRLTATITSSCIRLIAVYFDAGLLTFSLIFLFEYGTTGLFYYLRVLRDQFNFAFDNRISARKRHEVFWKKSEQLLLLFVALITVLYNRMDQVIINNLIGSYANGIYSPAISIVSATYVLASSVAMTRFPKFCEISYVDFGLAVRNIRTLAWKFFIVGFFVSCFIFIFAPLFINVVYGKNYSETITLIKIMAFGLPFAYFGIISNTMFLIAKRPSFLLVKTIVGLSLSATLLPFLALKFGLNGVAWSSILIIFIVEFVFCYFAQFTILKFSSKN